jgi:hypothetical protein
MIKERRIDGEEQRIPREIVIKVIFLFKESFVPHISTVKFYQKENRSFEQSVLSKG